MPSTTPCWSGLAATTTPTRSIRASSAIVFDWAGWSSSGNRWRPFARKIDELILRGRWLTCANGCDSGRGELDGTWKPAPPNRSSVTSLLSMTDKDSLGGQAVADRERIRARGSAPAVQGYPAPVHG